MVNHTQFRPTSKVDNLAHMLLDYIASSKIAVGETIATEAELLKMLPVSRPTLRECLRVLQFLEVIRLRPGPGAEYNCRDHRWRP